MSIEELFEYAPEHYRKSWGGLRMEYSESRGHMDLRKAIATTYRNIGPEHLITFSGAQEGIFVAAHALLSSEDHAINVVPAYQSLDAVPRTIAQVTSIPLHAEENWLLDIDRVKRAIMPETRLILLNAPHNPTGSLLDEERLAALVELARARGIYIFCDEVFRHLEHDERERLPTMADAYERGLSLNVLSKAYGLPGLRIGWIACRDKEVLQRMEGIRHYLSICDATPSRFLACAALEAEAAILRRSRSLLSSNFALLQTFMVRHQALFDWTPPRGGCIAFIRCRDTPCARQLASNVLERRGVLLMPGDIFQSPHAPSIADHFRIGYGRADFARGLAALSECLED